MNLNIPAKGDRFWIGPAYFLLAAAPGCWIPVLSKVLEGYGWGQFTTLAFLILPAAGILSPLIMGAKADQKIPANKLITWLVGGGTILLWLAFTTLEKGKSPASFLFFLGLNALVTGPAWSLLTTVAMANLKDPAREFGKFRVWGTIGWMAAGWLVSLLAMDSSPSVGYLAIVARVLGAVCCFMLPHTPPAGGPAKNWQETLGLGALRLLKQRDMLVFFLTSFLFSIPLAAYYPYTPLHLGALGWEKAAAILTMGQVTEVVAMLMMGYFLTRWRIKTLLIFAMGFGVLRYGFYLVGAVETSPWWLLVGIAFHGVCWTYFFEAGKVFLEKRVDKSMRAQSQALMSLVTNGFGGVIGILVVGKLHRTFENWTLYWLALTVMCLICVAVFAIGYRGREKGSQ